MKYILTLGLGCLFALALLFNLPQALAQSQTIAGIASVIDAIRSRSMASAFA